MKTEKTVSVKPTIYFIPGLGGTALMFKAQEALPYPIEVVELLRPKSIDESFKSYAKRMSKYIDTSKPYVIAGVSMGGMLATELSKRLSPAPITTILISSIKHRDEKPPHVRAVQRYIPIDKLITPTTFNFFLRYAEPILGVVHPTHKDEFTAMIRQHDHLLIKWGVQQVSKWKFKKKLPKNVLHIQGTRDHIFPHYWVKDAHLIKGGTHFVNMEQADMVNFIIKKHIQRITSDLTAV